MSRSALEKQFQRQKQREMQAQLQAVNAQHSLAYASQQYASQYGIYNTTQYNYGQGVYPMGGYAPVVGNIPISNIAGYTPITSTAEEYYDDPQEKSNVLPMHGNTTNFNINALLYNNIMDCEYFKALYQLRTYHEVIGEIQQSVHHVEPWSTGTSRYPSSAFCLLLKFMLMRLTVKQMSGLLEAEGTPYVRAIGFLYLRYTCPPNDLWKWFEPFLEDEETFQPFSDKNISMTVGNYCVKLLTEMNYQGTTLPRIPVPIERKMKVFLLLLEDKKKRRQKNLKQREHGFFKLGDKVRAIYSDAENEPAWYDAVIDSIDPDNDQKYWVTFPEYGNSECVDLGDMDMVIIHDHPSSAQSAPKESMSNVSNHSRQYDRRISRSRSRSEPGETRDRKRTDRSNSRGGEKDSKRSRNSRSRSRDNRRPQRSNSRSSSPRRESFPGNNLLAKVLQSERDASAAVGKHYASRPATYKDSLSLKFDTYNVRRKSPSPKRSPPRHREKDNRLARRSRTPSPKRETFRHDRDDQPNEGSIRYKSLKDKYGDASSSKNIE